MLSKTISSINFVFHHVNQKGWLVFWFFIRFLSAILPLITIYQFSHLIRLLEQKSPLSELSTYLLYIFLVRVADNLLRLASTTNLDYLINNITFDIHNFFLVGFKPRSKEERHAAIQAIRNFADASGKTLSIIKQPGLDSFVSLIVIPFTLFLVDFRSFVLILAYIFVYSIINLYTTQRYKELRDIQNTKTEDYFAKLQESNDVDLEQTSYTRHQRRLSRWTFTEWFALQNTAVFFYSLFLLYQLYLVFNHNHQISDLVLVMGYVTQTQSFLNSFTEIWYGFDDMSVALKHLAKNQSVSVINLSDLI